MYFAFFSFFIFGELVFRCFRDELPLYHMQWLQDVVVTNSIAFIFILFCFVIYLSKSKLNGKEQKSFLACSFSVKLKRRVICSTLMFVIILTLIGVMATGNPFANPLLFRQAIQGGGAAYFFVIFLVLLKLSGIIYFNELYFKRVKLLFHGYALFLIVFCLLTGFASLFAYFFIAGLMFINLKYNVKVVRWQLILGGFFLILLTPVYTLVRESLMFGDGNLLDVFNSFYDKVLSNVLLVVYNRFDYFDLQIAGSHVAREHADVNYIFYSFFQMIPRAIFPLKPPTYSTLMTEIYAPELIDMGVTINFGYINEFILYFGDYGPIVAGLFVGGLFFYCFYRMNIARRNGWSGIGYIVILHAYTTAFMGGGYINDMPVAILVISCVVLTLMKTPGGVIDYELARKAND